MKGWKSFLLWEGIPFLLLFFFFGSLSIINWDYEKKLVSLDASATDWTGIYLGPILWGCAVGMATLATILLYFAHSEDRWTKVWVLIVTGIILIFPSLFLIVLSPAAITMIEQMRTVPNNSPNR